VNVTESEEATMPYISVCVTGRSVKPEERIVSVYNCFPLAKAWRANQSVYIEYVWTWIDLNE